MTDCPLASCQSPVKAYALALERLQQLEAAALRVNGFAGHDDDCAINRYPNEGVCSCGYTSAYRFLLDQLGEK